MEGEDDDDPWNLNGNGDNDDYQNTYKIATEMDFENAKKEGNFGAEMGLKNLINYNCIKIFQKTKFIKDAEEAAQYLTS
jgi:hypothetical protein